MAFSKFCKYITSFSLFQGARGIFIIVSLLKISGCDFASLNKAGKRHSHTISRFISLLPIINETEPVKKPLTDFKGNICGLPHMASFTAEHGKIKK